MTGNEFAKKSYGYALGAIKATSHPPLSEDDFRRLRDCDLKGFKRLLDELGWARGIEGDIPERIEGEFNYAVNFIKDISPDKSLTDLLLFEEDSENLKLFLKAKILNVDVSDIANRGASVPIEIVRACVEASDFTLIGEEVHEELKEIEFESDPFIISSKADRAIFLHTLKVAKKKNKALYTMLLKYGEAKNQISEIRLKQMGVDSKKYKDLLLPVSYKSLENDTSRSDDEIISHAKEKISRAMYELRSGENFAPIAEYFFAKKTEAGMLRLILAECELKGLGEEVSDNG
ncbi:MAG: hypothetical protein E7582_04120 [Ruminococcaceae bacterium]|nr:hypothetical protein [Oscillospiraceae bacterium]